MNVRTLPTSACACSACMAMCEKRPCWPLPEEARVLAEAGFGRRLAADCWVGSPSGTGKHRNVYVLCGAPVGHEGGPHPFPSGHDRCTFLDADGRCELHALGLKPLGGRVAHHDGTPRELQRLIACDWETEEAQAMVEEWRR